MRRVNPGGMWLRLAGGLVVTVLIAVGAVLWTSPEDAPPSRFGHEIDCDTPLPLLRRVQRGYVSGRSGDVVVIERRPHQFGTRHSSPHAYTQRVPLLLFGPGYIRRGVDVDRPVTVADLAPTEAELMGFDEFPERDGRVLWEALVPEDERRRPPKLIVTVVWDGGGWNVLRRWRDSWPVVKRIATRGALFRRATVGSSPSITPSVHATIGTGAFPATHGLSDAVIRTDEGLGDGWEGSSPKHLEIATLADLWDQANGNKALVGLLARDDWHLGMIGHGTYLEEGDKDLAVLDDLETHRFRPVPPYFGYPGAMDDFDALRSAIREVDLRDGLLDDRWLDNKLLLMNEEVRLTPAWSIYQRDRIVTLLDRAEFGTDDITDLFFTNFKGTDLAGHQWNMIQPEVRDNLSEQDRQLGILIKTLNELVGKRSYVLVLTADHGMTPSSTASGGWSIDLGRMTEDIESALDSVDNGRGLVADNRGYQIFLHPAELAANDLTAPDVAAFLRGYRVKDNLPVGQVDTGNFRGPPSSRLFLTALTEEELPQAIACAGDSRR